MMRRQQPVSQVALAIRRAVKQQPGIHFRGLARAARVSSAGQLRHHLDRLEHQGILVEVEDGRYKRFFVAGDQEPRMRAEMARFSRAVPRRIAKLLLVNPMNRTELRRSLGCADSTLGYHLTRMVLLGDLARVRGPTACLYSLTNTETVRKILLVQGALAQPGSAETGTSETEAIEAQLSNPQARSLAGLPLGFQPPQPPAKPPAPGRPPSPSPPPVPQPDPAPKPPGPLPPMRDDQPDSERTQDPEPAPQPRSEPDGEPDPIAPPAPDESTEWPGPDFGDDLAGPIP